MTLSMKISFWYLIIAYCATFIFYTAIFLTSTTECEAYWIHDDSIHISSKWLVSNCFYLFLLPIHFLLIPKFFKIEIPMKILLAHFLVSWVSISLLALAINQPCQSNSGGHYMFIDTFMTLGYYLFKLISFVILCVIIVMTLMAIVKQMKKPKT
jgi:hypothetical protein